jgi:hypothetical protein
VVERALVLPLTDGTEESEMAVDKELRAAYGKLVAATWANDQVLSSLKANPVKVCNDYGMPTKAGATVDVQVVEPTGQGSFTSIQAAWILGDKTGKYDLWIPQKPSGAGEEAEGDGCTCTPCTTCT